MIVELIWIFSLFVMLAVVECESTCPKQLSVYTHAFETKREEACQSSDGLAIRSSQLEPLLKSMADFLQNQPAELKGKIPKRVVKTFTRAQKLLKAADVDLCDEKVLKSIVYKIPHLRQFPASSFDHALNSFCADYLKFMESEEGKKLMEDWGTLFPVALNVEATVVPEKAGE